MLFLKIPKTRASSFPCKSEVSDEICTTRCNKIPLLWIYLKFSINFTPQKVKFSIKDFFSICDQMWQETADLVTFTKEILNEKLHFLCSASSIFFIVNFLFYIAFINSLLTTTTAALLKLLTLCNIVLSKAPILSSSVSP